MPVLSGNRSGAPLRILITNLRLTERTGTEMYVIELAQALVRAGHLPHVYSPVLGPVALALKGAVAVSDDLAAVPTPDIVHGHHSLQTLSALLAFPRTPGIFVCHDRLGPHDTPPLVPRLLRHVAVDDNCADRLAEAGVPVDQRRVLLNAVDLAAFPRRPALPAVPRKALVFSNAAREDNYLNVVRAACARHGLALDTIGLGTGRPETRPGERLQGYDIVFAKARCALEALATGCAVVLCDEQGLGPLVTSDDVARLRRLNLGMRTLTDAFTTDAVSARIARYDPADAAAVCERIRATATVEALAADYVALYLEVIAEHASAPRPTAEAESQAFGLALPTSPDWTRRRVALLEEERRTLLADLHEARRRPWRLWGRVLRRRLLAVSSGRG